MRTAEEKEFADRVAKQAEIKFSAACRDPDISKESFDRLRREYLAALNAKHAAHGFV